MKIKLKHLAPYYPYELDIMYDGQKWLLHALFNTCVGLINETNDDPLDGAVKAMYKSIKPILRPLSDLTKEQFPDGSENQNVRWWEIKIEVGVLNSLNYDSIQELLKEHYDIFGLIDKGLAIDINKLK